MTEKKITGVVLSNNNLIHVVESEGKRIEGLSLTDKVLGYNPNGLEVGKIYNITYSDDVILFARLSTEQITKKSDARRKFEDTSLDREDKIQVLAIMKACSEFSNTTDELKKNTKDMFEWLNDGGYSE